MKTTYTPGPSTSLSDVYPNGVAVPVGSTPVAFAPPQEGQAFIAADTAKGKNTSGRADARIVVAKEDNSATSAPRVIVETVELN